jgi:hypothetical protein
MEPDTEATAALSPAQRYFYDVNGYVLLKGVFSAGECQRFIDLADRMDADDSCPYKHDGYPKSPTQTALSRCAWYDPHLLKTALHETLLPIIEDTVGGEVRLEEHQFIINYPDPAGAADSDGSPTPEDVGWHRGIAPNFGSFQADGHYHCLFTKAFIYLTDNGPGRGTWVVPGSHRMDLPVETLRAFIDESLVRQLESRAGDVLILNETLVHAGPRLTSRPARYSLVYGYTAPFMQTWKRYDPPADLLGRVTPRQRRLLSGMVRYGFRRGQF